MFKILLTADFIPSCFASGYIIYVCDHISANMEIAWSYFLANACDVSICGSQITIHIKVMTSSIPHGTQRDIYFQCSSVSLHRMLESHWCITFSFVKTWSKSAMEIGFPSNLSSFNSYMTMLLNLHWCFNTKNTISKQHIIDTLRINEATKKNMSVPL